MIEKKEKEKNIYSLIIWSKIVAVTGYIFSAFIILIAILSADSPNYNFGITFIFTGWAISTLISSTIFSFLLKNKAYTLETLMNIEKKN